MKTGTGREKKKGGGAHTGRIEKTVKERAKRERDGRMIIEEQ